MRRQTWYFTFGSGQPHARRFFVVEDATYDEARERMLHAFGQQWAFQYSDAQWFDEDGVSQQEKYSLEQIR